MELDKKVAEKDFKVTTPEFAFIKWPSVPSSFLPAGEVGSFHVLLLVCSGSLQMKVDGTSCEVKAGCFADFLLGTRVEFVSKSADLEAYFLAFSGVFEQSMFRGNPPFPVSYPIAVRACPVLQFPPEIVRKLAGCMGNISEILTDKENLFHTLLLYCEITQLVVEAANYRMKCATDSISCDTKRKRMIFTEFCRLLDEYVHICRTIEFYAEKLCISPQYLSRVVKEISGKTVYGWISEVLFDKIVHLMDTTPMSIMQIADQLNFSDISSLNKFFKKHKGIAPSQYRKNVRPENSSDAGCKFF